MSGDNYVWQPLGLVVQGSDVSLRPEWKFLPCIWCSFGGRHEYFALNATSVQFLRIAKRACSVGISGNAFRVTSH